jgi:hypothetical protein
MRKRAKHKSKDFADFAEFSTPMKWLFGLGAIGAGLFWWMNKASAEAPSGETPNLELAVTFKGKSAPGSDKLKAIGRLLKGIMGNDKFKLSSGAVIDGCPTAPGDVSIIHRDAPKDVTLSTGPGRFVVYKVHAKFGGEFDKDHPFLRDEVSDCIFKILQTVASGGKVEIVGFRGVRIAA